MSTEESISQRRLLTGRVVSDKMDKTVTVQVTRLVKHARYHKYVSRRKNYKAHDEDNACQMDDEVVIQESRPLSRTKRWVVIQRRDATQ
jgi:small subunit ribosomal protein S17